MAELTVDLLLEDNKFRKDLDAAAKRARRAGEKIGSGITSPVSGAFKSIAKIAGGFAIGSLLADIPGQITRAFGASIGAAQKQEDAINRLNSALRRTGEFTKELSEEFQSFASALQSQSTVGDEVILQQIAYAKSLGLTNDQAKEFVTAALNASAALDKDFGSTLQQLIKTLSGLQGELGESVNEIRGLTTEQLKAGEAAAVFNRRFAGAARSELNTYSGSVKSLGNAFGDFTESLGQYVTQSEGVNSATRSITNFFSDLALRLKPNKSLADSVQLIQNRIQSLQASIAESRANLAQNSTFIDRFALQKNIEESGKEIDKLLAKIKELRSTGSAAAEDAFGPFQEAAKKTTAISQQEIDKQKQAIASLGLSQLEQIRKQEQEQINALEKARSFNDQRIFAEKDFETRLAEVKALAREQERVIFEQARAQQEAAAEKERQSLLNSQFTFENFGKSATTVFEDLAKSAKVTSKDVGSALVNGIGRGTAQAFSALGAALVNGEDALKAFTKAFLQQIGQQAQALGTQFILEGTAYLFIPGKQALGSGLIAAGGALAAFGGALGALTGGGGGAPASSGQAGGVGGGSFQPDADLRTDVITDERLDPETRVQINVDGNVLSASADDLGIRLAQILQDASLNENVRVVGGLA